MANLILKNNTPANDVMLELNRGTNASWRMVNSSGTLYLKCNYTSEVGNYFDVFSLAYNTGNAWLKAALSVDGDATIGGNVTIASGKTLSVGYTTISSDAASSSAFTLYLPKKTDDGSAGQAVWHTNNTAIGSTTQPVYITTSGMAKAGSTYAGGTKVTFNGTDKGGSTASFYAPTANGTSGQVLIGQGTSSAPNAAPTWVDQNKLTGLFTSLTSSASKNLSITVGGTTKEITALYATALSNTEKIGSTTKPVYFGTDGKPAEGSTYAGGTKVTLNGTAKGASTASFYAPTAAGTSGYVLTSSGSGAPTWTAQTALTSVFEALSSTTSANLTVKVGGTEKAITALYASALSNTTAIGSTTKPVYFGTDGKPTAGSTYAGGTKVTLNGSAKGGSTASFYAPTAAGTSGQLLVSSGGAPTWKSLADVADSRYVNVSGDTMTGSLIVDNGNDLVLRATSGSIDSGDIIYKDGSDVEVGRLWISNATLNFRNSESATAGVVLHTQNYTSYLDGRYVNAAGDTMSGELKMNNNKISGIGDLAFADPGNNEGITWTGGNGWWIYESPDDLTNAAGNLQFVHNSTRRLTIRTNGTIAVNGTLELANNTWNAAGDDVYFGDNNIAGGFCIKGKNGATNLSLVSYNSTDSGRITYDQSNKCIKFSFH